MKKVITYGTYDLLHQGHINLLKREKLSRVSSTTFSIVSWVNLMLRIIFLNGSKQLGRRDVQTKLRILKTEKKTPVLQNNLMFMALTDRMVNQKRIFFTNPHTTRVIWSMYRLIYIFTDALGRIHCIMIWN